MIGTDYHKSGVFAGCARVGLQRRGGKPRDGGKVFLQFANHLHVPLGLIGGSERVHVGELGHAQRHHRGGRVELHGARAERNHTVGHGYVAHFKFLDVAHHVVLAAVLVEHGLGQNIARAHEFGNRKSACFIYLYVLGSLAALGERENLHHGAHLVGSGHLVETHAHTRPRGIEEVDSPFQRKLLNDGHLGLYLQSIEIVLRDQSVAHSFQSVGHRTRMRVNVLRDAAKSLGTVIYGIESDHRSHKRRGGAYIGSSPFAFYVLFAHLERHAQSLVAQTVHRHSDDTAGHIALEGLARCHITCARASESHRSTHSLRSAHRNVGAPLCGGFEHCQRHQISHRSNERSAAVRLFDERSIIAHVAVCRRILHNRAELLAGKFIGCVIVAHYLYAERFAAGDEHVERLGKYILVHEKHVATLFNGIAAAQREHHQHRLGSCGSLVQKRAVAYLHAGERNHGGLEVQKRFQTALRYFGLIGRIGGIPCWVFEHVTADYRRHGRRVIPHSDERTQDAVLGGKGADMLGEPVLGHTLGGQSYRFAKTDRGGNHLRDEFLDALHTYRIQHEFELCGRTDTHMTVAEFIERHSLGLDFVSFRLQS